jgi:hypothetical protein
MTRPPLMTSRFLVLKAGDYSGLCDARKVPLSANVTLMVPSMLTARRRPIGPRSVAQWPLCAHKPPSPNLSSNGHCRTDGSNSDAGRDESGVIAVFESAAE